MDTLFLSWNYSKLNPFYFPDNSGGDMLEIILSVVVLFLILSAVLICYFLDKMKLEKAIKNYHRKAKL